MLDNYVNFLSASRYSQRSYMSRRIDMFYSPLSDWNATDYRNHGEIPLSPSSYKLALPLVLRYLTPTPVAVIGLGAVSAAVMSSCDSSCLAAGSMFAESAYRPLRNGLATKYGWEKVRVLWYHAVGGVFCMNIISNSRHTSPPRKNHNYNHLQMSITVILVKGSMTDVPNNYFFNINLGDDEEK